MSDRYLAGWRACREAAARVVERENVGRAGIVSQSLRFVAAGIRYLPDPAPAAEPDARVAEIRSWYGGEVGDPQGTTPGYVLDHIAYLLAKLEDRR